jgi:hypothetical protein
MEACAVVRLVKRLAQRVQVVICLKMRGKLIRSGTAV